MRTEVIVVGGGQAGLAMGFHLARRGVDHVILDAAPRVGHAWRSRWDSLRLFTPARHSGLPGMPFPGDPEAYPGKDRVADYLEEYAGRFGLPVRLGEAVTLVRPGGAGYVARTAAATYEAAGVVVATGPFQRPWVPALAASLPPETVQLHAAAYHNPRQLPPGEVLVVGGGNSGVQIAEELSRTHRVRLSVGSRLPRLPERVLGRSVFWWLERAGLLDVPAHSPLGRRMSRTDTLVGTSPRMLARAGAVELVGRATGVRGGAVVTEDGRSLRVASVVWATGFRPDHGWIGVPVLDGSGRPVHRRGVTPAPGFFFLGLPWLHTRGSALLGWVGRDAAHLAGAIKKSPLPSAGPSAR